MITIPPALVLSKVLIAGGVSNAATAPTWATKIGGKPENPDTVVVITDTTGTIDVRDMNSHETFAHYGVQILVRSAANDYLGGWQKAQQIAAYLDTVFNRPVTLTLPGGSPITLTLQAFALTAQPVKIGTEEERNRDLFTLNGLAAIF